MNTSTSNNGDKDEQTGASVLGDEPDTSRSLAATLRLAAAKGYLDKNAKKKSAPQAAGGSKKVKFEAEAYMVEDKRDDHRRDRRSRPAHLQEVKEPEYKPEINLEYTDDDGRKLETQKDAFRYMCYKFHGKGPGKNKIDKRLKRLEMERKARGGLSTDAVTSSASQMMEKHKELKTPYIVLSKGGK